MPDTWDPACEQIFLAAKRQAEALNHTWLGTEHVALAMLSLPQSLLASKVRGLERNVGDLCDAIIADFDGVTAQEFPGGLPLTPRMKQIVAMADAMASDQKLAAIGEHQLLHALIEGGPGVFIRVLLRWGVEPGALWRATPIGTSTPTVANLQATLVDEDAPPAAEPPPPPELPPPPDLPDTVHGPTQATLPVKAKASPPARPKATLPLPVGTPSGPVPMSHNPALLDFGVVSRPRAVSPTPHLDRIGRDLTALARSGQGAWLVPRVELLGELEMDLCRQTRGASLLVGPSGSGKTALVELLARYLLRPEVPHELLGVRLVEVPAAEILGSGFDHVLQELEGHRVALLLDEVHRPLKQGRTRGYQALKQVLDTPGLLLLGTCTPEAWHEWIASEPSLKRRLHVVDVPPTAKDETLAILRARVPEWARQHAVEVLPEALEGVWNAHQYPQCGTMPDLALDLLEEACLRARAQHRPVDGALVAAVLQRRTGK